MRSKEQGLRPTLAEAHKMLLEVCDWFTEDFDEGPERGEGVAGNAGIRAIVSTTTLPDRSHNTGITNVRVFSEDRDGPVLIL